MNRDYIRIIKLNSALKDSKYYPFELKQRIHAAMKQMELEMTAAQIIENVHLAFEKRTFLTQNQLSTK